MSEIVVEFFGLIRANAKRHSITLRAETARQALRELLAMIPALHDVYYDERLSPRFLLSLDGEQFLRDLDDPLPPEARLLLLSADAGG